MYRKNTASQYIYFVLVNATTGAALTGATVTAYRALADGSQASATGTTTELGLGQYRFNLSQADTDADNGSFLFVATNAVPVEKTVVFTAADPTDATAFGLSRLDAAITSRLAPTTAGRTLGVDASGQITVGAMAANTLTASALATDAVNEIVDQVWDEQYSQHTTAGSFGKLMDLLRKANLTIEGTVSTAITPTTLTFSSNVSAVTSAYAHSVLLFVSGPLAGENSPIISYNSTNGVFVLEEPLTAAPGNGDEFVVIATSHVHAIADIQAGLALQTTSLAINAKTQLITAGNISVLQDRVNDSTITMQYNEVTTATVNLDEDTTSATLQFVVQRPDGSDVLSIANASITRNATSFTVTITTAVTATIGQYLWSLRDLTGGGNRVVTKGVLTVQNAASIDA